jgi:branched-chain amino acid aminotransferase
VKDGKPGPITRALQKAFFGLFKGETEDRWGWLEPLRKFEAPAQVLEASYASSDPS